MDKNIIPVLLGADLNCYNIARAFHEAYGVISEAFGRYEISATLASKIIRFHRVPMLDSDSVFLEEMNRFAQEHQNDDTLLILIGCTDDYANLIARSRDALGDRFVIPYNPQALMDEFQSKERFYCCCDKHGILYPKTVIVRDCTARSASDYTEEMLGFSYPIIVKPSNSVVYWKHPFDGMNKVYVSDSPARTKEILDTIFASGYDDSVILQDRIPGNDAGMLICTSCFEYQRDLRVFRGRNTSNSNGGNRRSLANYTEGSWNNGPGNEYFNASTEYVMIVGYTKNATTEKK